MPQHFSSKSCDEFSKRECLFNQKQRQPSKSVLVKSVLKICSKFTGEHPCQSAISVTLQSNFIENELWHGSSLVNLLHIFRGIETFS